MKNKKNKEELEKVNKKGNEVNGERKLTEEELSEVTGGLSDEENTMVPDVRPPGLVWN